jgi:hypothetical protein
MRSLRAESHGIRGHDCRAFCGYRGLSRIGTAVHNKRRKRASPWSARPLAGDPGSVPRRLGDYPASPRAQQAPPSSTATAEKHVAQTVLFTVCGLLSTNYPNAAELPEREERSALQGSLFIKGSAQHYPTKNALINQSIHGCRLHMRPMSARRDEFRANREWLPGGHAHALPAECGPLSMHCSMLALDSNLDRPSQRSTQFFTASVRSPAALVRLRIDRAYDVQ